MLGSKKKMKPSGQTSVGNEGKFVVYQTLHFVVQTIQHDWPQKFVMACGDFLDAFIYLCLGAKNRLFTTN